MQRAVSAPQWAPDDIGWIRSYLLTEPDGSIGTACVYRATSPEAIRAHAARAGLPIDEIVASFETLVVEPDPVEAGDLTKGGRMRRIFRKRLALAIAAAALAAGGVQVMVALASGGSSDLAAARRATANYHRVSVAQDAGYAEFRDADGIACIDNPPDGAMGVHYVNGSYVGDTTLDPTTPEAVVYEPMPNGRLRLVALEYIVFQEAWDAEHSAPPELFGQTFMLVPAPNRFGIPAFYQLHTWIWKDNPSGMFQMWNPRVHC